MTIKEKFNIRKARINEYFEHVSFCREIERVVVEKERAITALVDADKVNEKFACRKSYITTAPATNMSEIGDNVYPQIQYCHRFNANPCPIFNCPYHAKREQYRNELLLLEQAVINKRLAFKRIFERIK